MVRKVNGDVYITEFESISDLVHFIKTNDYKSKFVLYNRCDSIDKSEEYKKFAMTESYEEAEQMLLHGWEHGAVEIKNKVKAKSSGVELKQKIVYDVAGYQCSVPRYLQGIPTNMINKKAVPQKNKVITINKMATYSWQVTPEEIITESVKVLQLINRLEKQGYRVNLNIIYGTREINSTITKLRIKQSSQRLNIKQVSFPLVHPSMLRRIIFAVWERQEENNYKNFTRGYGHIICYETMKQYINKGEYLIPTIVHSKEITELEQYKV